MTKAVTMQRSRNTTRAIAIKPDSAELYRDRGLAYAAIEQHRDAIKSYDRALELDPHDAEAFSHKGTSLAELGMYRDALEAFEKALEKNPGSRRPGLAKETLSTMSGNFQKHGTRTMKACGSIRRCGRLHRRGILAGLKDQKAAIESYDRAIAIDPSFSIAYFTKGSALEALGQFEDAAECTVR